MASSKINQMLAVLTGAAAALAVGLAQAQGGTSATGDVQGVSEPANAHPIPATAEGKLELGRRVVKQGKQLSRSVSNLLNQAREDKDVIQMTCLDDKLTQTNVSTRNAEQRLGALRQAIQTKDLDRQDHEATVLSVLGRRITVLEKESGQCVGQDLYETGETKVTMTVDPNTPRENASKPPLPDMPSIPMVPPPSSPVD